MSATSARAVHSTLKPLLRVRGLRKAFPGVQALNGVDFDLYPGEVHALVGENGAGKSTLIKIFSGAFSPDEGTIEIEGRPYSHLTPRTAQTAGLATIYQERNLVTALSVAENILLGRLPGVRLWVDWAKVRREAATILDWLGLELDLDVEVGTLGVARQQGVEIAKALHQQARVVIMDEPTSAFSQTEVEHLFKIIRTLREQGLGIIYISHRLEEVFEIADRLTVLRDGKVIGTRSVSETTRPQLIKMMVGRDLSGVLAKEHKPAGQAVLHVQELTRGRAVQSVNLVAHRGEILGLAGMVGSGRTELLRLIYGVDQPDGGKITLLDYPLKRANPRMAIARGMALVPEDRKTQGLVLCLDVHDNTAMVSRNKKGIFLNLSRERAAVRSQMKAADLRASGLDQEVQYLSGGNQQKVVLAKWLEAGAELFLFDEPTRGVDIAAKMEIHRLMIALAQQGKAVIMASSEMPEVLAISDRILVMRHGRIAGEFLADAADEHTIIACALGETNGD